MRWIAAGVHRRSSWSLCFANCAARWVQIPVALVWPSSDFSCVWARSPIDSGQPACWSRLAATLGFCLSLLGHKPNAASTINAATRVCTHVEGLRCRQGSGGGQRIRRRRHPAAVACHLEQCPHSICDSWSAHPRLPRPRRVCSQGASHSDCPGDAGADRRSPPRPGAQTLLYNQAAAAPQQCTPSILPSNYPF